jgi:hypothetical protein
MRDECAMNGCPMNKSTAMSTLSESLSLSLSLSDPKTLNHRLRMNVRNAKQY